MDPILFGTLAVLALFVVGTLGMPVAVAMILVSAVGGYIAIGASFTLTMLETLPYSVSADYALVVLPMFMFMGTLIHQSGIIKDLFEAANRWVGGYKGGLYYATILSSGIFAATNGSTIVSAVLFTRIALPEMIRHGYNHNISAAVICCAGTFAALIPPSISLVVYGIIAELSIGQLLMAGLIPGALTIAVYMLGIAAFVRIWPHWAPAARPRAFTMREKFSSLAGLWPIALLFAFVMGGIYTGTVFPSAAGAVGAAGAFLIAALRGRMTTGKLVIALKDAVSISASLLFIIVGGLLLTRVLLASGFVNEVTDWVLSLGLSQTTFILMIVILYLILGIFVDGISLMVMTVPILHPIAVAFGIDGIWFAIIVVKLIEIAIISPPVGMNLYAVIGASAGKISSGGLFWGVMPFMVLECISLAIIIAWPELSLYLPRMMMGN